MPGARATIFPPLANIKSLTEDGRMENWDTLVSLSFPGGSGGKESTCNAGDLGFIPVLGRSPGERNVNLLQYSCMENPMDREEPGGLHSKGSQRVGHD